MGRREFTWKTINVALLTHTHTDHWHEATLTHFARLGIILWCHPAHLEALAAQSAAFIALHSAGLVRTYAAGRVIDIAPGLVALPLPVSHDAGETFGFRFEGGPTLFGPGWTAGYAADLGCWDADLVRALADVDLLALEFNHDEHLQRASGRPFYLIERVLGDCGHLSNRQAQGLLSRILAESEHVRLRHVVPLHLSRDCNRPELALAAASNALLAADRIAEIVVATQHEPGPTLDIGCAAVNRRARRRYPAA
jgi:phosphoribosyl 1,2-cyclic phosphodiesterase